MFTTYQRIYTISEYISQGFTEEEAYAVRLYDRLFNKSFSQGITEREAEKMDAIVKRLGL